MLLFSLITIFLNPARQPKWLELEQNDRTQTMLHFNMTSQIKVDFKLNHWFKIYNKVSCVVVYVVLWWSCIGEGLLPTTLPCLVFKNHLFSTLGLFCLFDVALLYPVTPSVSYFIIFFLSLFFLKWRNLYFERDSHPPEWFVSYTPSNFGSEVKIFCESLIVQSTIIQMESSQHNLVLI